MPKRSSKKQPRDFTKLAAKIVEKATRSPSKGAKNQAAVELGRLGGLKGGKRRAEMLSAEQRTAIARKAAAARWQTNGQSG